MNPERANYVLIRGTGLLLVVLALGHFALTHLFTDVADTGSDFIDERWASAGWLIWDATLLLAVLVHAAAGFRTITRDLARRRSRMAYAIVLGVLVAFGLLGVITLVVHASR